MSISTTAAGSAGTYGILVSSLSTSAYNQTAGHCMYVVVFVSKISASATGVSIVDTAGNSFVQSLQYNSTGSNGAFYVVFTVTSCLGNTNNVVTVTLTGGSANSYYATVTYYDVSGCSLLDVVTYAPASSTGNSQSVTITTAYANEAILTTISNPEGYSSFTATQPTGFIAGATISNLSLSAYEIVSTIQSGVTLTWSASTATAGIDMIVVSFALPPIALDDSLGMSFNSVLAGYATTTKF